ncbi:type II toxin-antitoxin system HipA family toxin [Pseudomonas asplenii]|uniref:type II toxin-antitoxin system HipA family toxin n=1 Tax=Pseudomonas asplenii TaxID=53407 RepID=UPI0037C86A13
MSSPLALEVATPDGFAGDLFWSERTRNYLFRYDRRAGHAHELCLSMPLRIDEYSSDQLHPIFQMNLPEGFLLDELKRRLSKIARLDPMMLLAISGSGYPIGRLRVRVPQAVIQVIETSRESGNQAGVKLHDLLAWDGTQSLFAELVDRYILHSGISGIQPKVLVPEALTTGRVTGLTPELIVKAGRHDFPGLAINEFLCMSMARSAGLPVPEFFLSQNHELFIMRRFDRTAQGEALGFEDMAVITGRGAEAKYSGSYEMLAKAIDLFVAQEHQAEDQRRLFRMVALSCIVGNGDAHLKNFGLLYSTPGAGDARLAPAYDIVNTTAYIPEDVLALNLDGSKSLFASRLGLLELGRRCRIEQPQEEIRQVMTAVFEVLEREVLLCEAVPAVTSAIRQHLNQFDSCFG